MRGKAQTTLLRISRFVTIALLVVFLLAAIVGAVFFLATGANAAPTRIVRCDSQHPADCQTAVVYWRAKAHRAERAVAWQRAERVKQQRNPAGYGVDHAIRLAAATFGVSEIEMRRIGSCESHLDPLAANRHSTARGLFQWLSSSWAAQGISGFSVYDAYANAMAAARARARDGSWRQWVCHA